MFYIVYKTINLVNNKFYIGKHRQNIDPHQFDGYYGSGSQIINAVKKFPAVITVHMEQDFTITQSLNKRNDLAQQISY